MKHPNRHLRHALLASTALVAAGFVSTASAQSTIDASDGTITVTAALEAFIAATDQRATDTEITAQIDGADERIIQQQADAISTGQTIRDGSFSSFARLNQAENEITGNGPTEGDFSGDIGVLDGGDLVSIEAGVGILSVQDATGSDVEAVVGSENSEATFNIDLTSDAISGDVTITGTETLADAVANEADNRIQIEGSAAELLSVPASIASLQRFTPEDDGGDDAGTVKATTFGDVLAELSGDAGDLALQGDVRLDENVIGARAGVNLAENELLAGNANGGGTVSGGTATGTDRLDASKVGTPGAIAEFSADFGIASLQLIEPSDDDERFASVEAAVTGNIDIQLEADTDVTSDLLALRGNTIIAQAEGNVGANTAAINFGGVEDVSVAVASVQEFTGDAANDGDPDFDLSAAATGNIRLGDGSGDAAGNLDGTEAILAGNRIIADASGNEAENIAAVTGTNASGAAQMDVVGSQTATNLAVGANTTGSIRADLEAVGETDASSIRLSGNEITASASLNEQTNISQSNGVTGGVDTTVTGLQTTTGSFAVATLQSGDILSNTESLASGSSVQLSNNRLQAVAAGNEQTNLAFVNGTTAGARALSDSVQGSTNTTVRATITDATVQATSPTTSDTDSVTLANNEALASAVLNRSTSQLVNNGSSDFDSRSLVAQTRQTLTDGTSGALVTASLSEFTSGDTDPSSTATALLANNRVLASATGNVSTTRISNRTNSFSFSR